MKSPLRSCFVFTLALLVGAVVPAVAQEFVTNIYVGPRGYIPGNFDFDAQRLFDGTYNGTIHAAFGNPRLTTGQLDLLPGFRQDVVDSLLAKGRDVSLSLGGEGGKGFVELANEQNMAHLCTDLRHYSISTGVRGVDLDWEFPQKKDSVTYNALVDSLDLIFDWVSLTVGYDQGVGYIPAHALQVADEVQVMTYLQSGPWDQWARHHNATLAHHYGPFSAQASLNYWLNVRHVPASKVLSGFTYFATVFPGVKNLGDRVPDPSRTEYMPNFEVQRRWGHLPVLWDETGQFSYIKVPGDTLVVWETRRDFDAKVAYAKSRGLRGIFIWQYGQEVEQLGHITDVEQPQTALPTRFQLAQNYPNPFNPSTTIRFELQKTSHVTLKVYNVRGQHVATLVNAKREAGPNVVLWHAGTLPGGIYFYRLRVGEFEETRRMTLVK